MAQLESLDSLALQVELGFHSWEEEFEYIVDVFRLGLEASNCLHTLNSVKASKLSSIFSSFPYLEDKLRFTQTLELEKQLRLLREKIKNLEEQADRLHSLVERNLELFQRGLKQDGRDIWFAVASDYVSPLEYFTFLDFISRVVCLYTSEIKAFCFYSQLFVDQDTVINKESQDVEKLVEQSRVERSEVNDWFLKLRRLRETRRS